MYKYETVKQALGDRYAQMNMSPTSFESTKILILDEMFDIQFD